MSMHANKISVCMHANAIYQYSVILYTACMTPHFLKSTDTDMQSGIFI